jgi:hypothetical protein
MDHRAVKAAVSVIAEVVVGEAAVEGLAADVVF